MAGDAIGLIDDVFHTLFISRKEGLKKIEGTVTIDENWIIYLSGCEQADPEMTPPFFVDNDYHRSRWLL
jgi:hypothetical protein